MINAFFDQDKLPEQDKFPFRKYLPVDLIPFRCRDIGPWNIDQSGSANFVNVYLSLFTDQIPDWWYDDLLTQQKFSAG